MIALFTDFTACGPYLGQLRAVLLRDAPGVPVVDLMSDAPAFRPRAAAHLLAALVGDFPSGTVFLSVVDPGVGSPNRVPAVVRAGQRWFVGPDNGLLDVVGARAPDGAAWRITWTPRALSNTFHGRDLFAPVAARLARGETVAMEPMHSPWLAADDGGHDLAEVIYIDGYGNAMTGLRAAMAGAGMVLEAGSGDPIERARTFADVAAGNVFWYENSVGLVEIAVNQGSAARALGLAVGAPVRIQNPPTR